jgi:hypothetical protein
MSIPELAAAVNSGTLPNLCRHIKLTPLYNINYSQAQSFFLITLLKSPGPGLAMQHILRFGWGFTAAIQLRGIGKGTVPCFRNR